MTVDRATVLERMRAYFEGKQPPAALASFESQSPRTLLVESLDVVDFILYLEETFGCELDVTEVGATLVNRNFGDLAGELAQRL